MGQITGAAELAMFISRQLSNLKPASRATAAQRSSASDAGNQSTAGPGAASGDLMALVLKRVRTIDPEDDERGRKAFRVFLESALLQELGGDLINDPAFYRLVDTIEGRMQDDPALRRAVDEASQVLLSLSV